MLIEKGRPENCSSRTENEIKCYDLLDSISVSYLRADHAAAFSMDICDVIAEKLDTHICKNLFLCNRQQTMFYLLLMPSDKKFKTKDLSVQISSARLSFADENHLKNLLDLSPGSVSVLGLMNDKEHKVSLLIDDDLLTKQKSLGIHPCINTSTVRITVEDFVGKLIPSLGHEPKRVKLPSYE